jgi:methyl-accepting chemotaxis protein
VQRLADENTVLMEKTEWKNAENVFLSTQNSVRGSLERGEMVKFLNILRVQRSVKGLLEFSLFNPEGGMSYSSDPGYLKDTLPPEVASVIKARPERFQRLTDGAFEIYEPMTVTSDCIRCHTTWKEGDSGGTLLCRFSTDSLRQSQQTSAASLVGMKTSQITNGLVITLFIAAFIFVLVILVVRYQIDAPLGLVQAHLTAASDRVRDSSRQISASSQSLAEGASEQAASLQETSSSLEEMASMTQRNSENARKANELAQRARSAADKGVGDMQAMSAAMEAIKSSSNDIAKIIKTIDEIAFQTNILALNAAVEAARAGDAGLGFAVVADEVRHLAQRCAHAAKDTAAMIEGAIGKTTQGVGISNRVAQTLNEIVTNVRQVDELVAEVASASREQTQGLTQINTAVGQMDKVTQSNAASAEETAAATEELNDQAEAMKKAVLELLKLIEGKQPSNAARTTKTPMRTGKVSRAARAGKRSIPFQSPNSAAQPDSNVEDVRI